jgi:hypothetical protein
VHNVGSTAEALKQYYSILQCLIIAKEGTNKPGDLDEVQPKPSSSYINLGPLLWAGGGTDAASPWQIAACRGLARSIYDYMFI